MKKNDVWIILTVLGVALLGLWFFHLGEKEDLTVVVKVDGEITFRQKLPAKGARVRQKLITPYGYNILQIEGNRVSMIEADCQNQICVHTGEISAAHQIIVCAPHHLSVEILKKTSDEAVDGVSR